MTWFRTKAGRLVHAPKGGVGGLADVYTQRGWKVVDDDTAVAEVTSGQAQARADADGRASDEVDAMVAASQAKPQVGGVPAKPGKTTTVPVDVPGVGEVPLEITVGGTPAVSAEVEAEAQKALAEEAPRTPARGGKTTASS